jgi:hypothetical protein
MSLLFMLAAPAAAAAAASAAAAAQIHVKGAEVMYFSRRGREHGRLSDYVVFDEVVRRQVGRDCCSMRALGKRGEQRCESGTSLGLVGSGGNSECMMMYLAEPGEAVILSGEPVAWILCFTELLRL